MHRFTIDLHGPLHGIDYGGEGRLVLLVHGLSGSAVNWVEVGEPLTAYGRVVAPELPGFGRTPPAGRRASVEGQTELLAELIKRESGAPALVVGNSMGAMTAMLVAGRYPELVDRLVLIDSPAPSPSVHGITPVWGAVMIAYLIPGLNKALLNWLHRQGTPEQRTEAGINLIAGRADRISRATRRLHAQVTTERNLMPWMHDAHPRGIPIGHPQPRPVLPLRPDGAAGQRTDPSSCTGPWTRWYRTQPPNGSPRSVPIGPTNLW